MGADRYAFYAHLQPGSITVGVGDRVRRGQKLGLLGSTGRPQSTRTSSGLPVSTM